MTPPPNAALLLHLSRCLEARAEGYVLEYRCEGRDWHEMDGDQSFINALSCCCLHPDLYEMRVKEGQQ